VNGEKQCDQNVQADAENGHGDLRESVTHILGPALPPHN